MITREQFEAEFHSRTLAYVPGFVHAPRPLVVTVGSGAHTPAGHALLVSLANQVARAHTHVVFVGDIDRPLQCRDTFGSGTLANATAGLARAINPFIEVDVASASPSCDPLLTIGVGAERDVDLALGCDGWLALVGTRAAVGSDEASIWGACLASCLGANAALHRVLGGAAPPTGSFSLWEYVSASQDPGPRMAGPINVGRVLQAGAGAVGSALDLYLAFFGIGGAWTIVDGDFVDISNLNRQLLFVAQDAGYPWGSPTNKAIRAAALLGPAATASSAWYGDDEAVVEGAYDVVLALANDRGVRGALQRRQPTVLLHATTSPNWQAQSHRHVAGHDDCIECRLPPTRQRPRFACTTAEVETPAGQRFDAALPPLSATAGLLLAAELARLQAGNLVPVRHNFTAVELSRPEPVVQRKIRRCVQDCTVRRPAAVRRVLDARSKWLFLDAE